MTKLKISAVSYTNTLPFIYGIENSNLVNDIELSKDIPSICAKKLVENNVDIGLVPVAAIPKLDYSEIISDFCIGASQAVRSVILASFKPLSEIKTVFLDYQSRSSVMLTRILAKKFWKQDFDWQCTSLGFENRVTMNEAAVIIGDKALMVEKSFPYVYDLAEEWIKYTQLPFVFAAWIANKKLDQSFKSNFNEALSLGVQSIDNLIKSYDLSYLPESIDPKEYLTKNIDFRLDDGKKEGLKLFLKFAGEFQ